jgi:O-antigen ligase
LESTTRYYRILLFFQLLPDNPIFGLGPGGWGKHVMIGDYRYPHNIFIELIIEFGLFGVLFLAIMSISTFWALRKILTNKSDTMIGQKILAMVWVYYALNTLTSGSLLNNTEFHVFSGILMGIMIKMNSKKWNSSLKTVR